MITAGNFGNKYNKKVNGDMDESYDSSSYDRFTAELISKVC